MELHIQSQELAMYSYIVGIDFFFGFHSYEDCCIYLAGIHNQKWTSIPMVGIEFNFWYPFLNLPHY